MFSPMTLGELGEEGDMSWIVKFEGSVLTDWDVSDNGAARMRRGRHMRGREDTKRKGSRGTYIPLNHLGSLTRPAGRVRWGGNLNSGCAEHD